MAAPSKFNPEYHIPWAWSLAIRGATDVDIASEFGVSERTINRWKFIYDANGKPVVDENGEKVLSEFGKILALGKVPADAQVEQALFKRATGFTVKEEEKIVEVGPDGSIKPVRVKTTERYFPPDTMAAMYWLNNRTRKTGDWTQKQVVTFDSTVDFQAQMRSIADLINNPVANRELPDSNPAPTKDEKK